MPDHGNPTGRGRARKEAGAPLTPPQHPTERSLPISQTWERGLGGEGLRLLVLLCAFFCALAVTTLARADGEAGLVVQNGDQVTTYCIAFSGDGITGQDLLKKAGISIEAYGGGSGLAVCALGATGCNDSSSFSSCFCQCQGGECTYWAFFTRQFGKNWVYSSLAFNLLKAKDGDVHGWKWGRGGPNSAPAPQDISFNQICGHDPRGGVAPTSTLAPTAALTQPPAPTAGSTSSSAQPTSSAGSPVPPDQPSATQAPPGGAPTVTVTIARATDAAPATAPAVPDAGTPPTDDGNGGSATYAAFGAIAALLLAGAGFGLYWRRRGA